MDPATDIKTGLKTGRRFWQWAARLRESWKQFARLDEFERRLAALEKRLERCPADGCKRCGALAWRVDNIQPIGGYEKVYHWKCGECGLTTEKVVRADQ
jgi:hypothetical protein